MESETNRPVSIHVQNLGKRFNREWIFRKLTFSFKSGHTYAITGPNGSGKSTLMQILWGQSLPSSGTVKYATGNNEIPETDIFNHIAIATPYMDLIEEFTLEEQLNFHFKLKNIRKGYSVDNLIDTMYLSSSRTKQIGNFSSGMKQRLKLGLAFYTEAQVYFLDEPGTNLDKNAFEWYLKELGNLPTSSLVLIASNNQEEYKLAKEVMDIMEFK